MKCYLTGCVAGFVAFSEDLKVIDYETFPLDEVAGRLKESQMGGITPEERSILERLIAEYDEVIVEAEPSPAYSEFGKIRFEMPSGAGVHLRENLDEILESITDIPPSRLIHDALISAAREKLRESLRESDRFLIQAINALDELDEEIGKLIERLREWYSLHFPELDGVRSHEQYVELVARYGDRERILENFRMDVEESIGSDISSEDLHIFMDLAENIRRLQRLRQDTERYIDLKMEKLAPNLRALAGANVGARLIAHAGGLRELAMLPSSTVQVLGAEKALFRHLKSNARPPKHGVIFQHPSIRSSPWWIRGKVARLLAGKTVIAVRKDVFSGEFDPEIIESFNERLELIKKKNKKPPVKKKRFNRKR
ncbi:NOP5/NOP56 family protein [Methanothermobacter sp. DP]|uniref:NOP5/NOP56 family protein n=1 Tax=unclassified Methanothermobacter TaxID=2631116 RepID=UPI002AA53829|nr:NOP5/NOP56 family protein [Methanothermobacter sp. DP]